MAYKIEVARDADAFPEPDMADAFTLEPDRDHLSRLVH